MRLTRAAAVVALIDISKRQQRSILTATIASRMHQDLFSLRRFSFGNQIENGEISLVGFEGTSDRL
jgi:hypothetical protein